MVKIAMNSNVTTLSWFFGWIWLRVSCRVRVCSDLLRGRIHFSPGFVSMQALPLAAQVIFEDEVSPASSRVDVTESISVVKLDLTSNLYNIDNHGHSGHHLEVIQ